MRLAAGADIASGRWVVVVLADGRFHRALLVDELDRIPVEVETLELLAVDIPIGLPADGEGWPRPADLEARALIRPLWSSVFLSPPRPVLDAAGYDDANRLHRRLTGKGLSRQTWGLCGHMKAAERFVADNPSTIEAHPEVCFWSMKGTPLGHSKKSWNGQMERRALLAANSIVLPDDLGLRVGRTAPDDVLDAAAAAWTAWRCINGEAQLLPAATSRPAIGRHGVIWF